MLLALLQEGRIKSRDIMPLSFVELCPLMQTSTLFIMHSDIMHSDIITQLNFALSQEYFDLLVLSIEMPSDLYGKTPKDSGFTSHYSIAKTSGFISDKLDRCNVLFLKMHLIISQSV